MLIYTSFIAIFEFLIKIKENSMEIEKYVIRNNN